MPILKVVFNNTTKTAQVLDNGEETPVGSVDIGTFNHPDITYPDSAVIYHGVRDLLYKRSAADPSQVGFWPNNIASMQQIVVDNQATPRLEILRHPTKAVNLVAQDQLILEVLATGGKAPLEYRWELDGDNTPLEEFETSTTPRLVIAGITPNLSGIFRCQVYDADGTTVYSKEAEVLVFSDTPVESLVATPDSATLSLATDMEGVTVEISSLPVGSHLGTLYIVNPPNGDVADAVLDGTTLTIIPVGIGENTVDIGQVNSDIVLGINITVTA